MPDQPDVPLHLTKDDLLDVARRALGPYADQLEAAGVGGWEILRAGARVMERVSQAIESWGENALPDRATGPARAMVEVSFLRPTASAGAVTMRAGTLVRASVAGAVFKTLADAVFGALDIGPISVVAEAVGASEEWNVRGQYTAPNGDVLRGEIDTIDLPLLDPPFSDQSIYVVNVPHAEGGRVGWLDVHGAGVLVDRTPGESDENYAKRVQSVDEAVTPTAIRRQLRRFFDGIGYDESAWNLVETWEYRLTAFWDSPEQSYQFYQDYDPTLWVYDDPRDNAPISNRWLDTLNMEAASILEFQDLPAVGESGFSFDDPAETQAALASSLGTRATPAFDLPDDMVNARECCYDGEDRPREAILKGLGDMLARITAQGTNITLHARGD